MKSKVALFLAVLLLFSGCTNRDSEPTPESSPESESSEPSASESSSPTDITEEESAEDNVEELTVKLIIPEGFTLPRIAMRLEELEVCTAEEFIDVAQNGDFSEFSLINTQADNPNRCFKLEGYLFPDTYEIYKNESPDSIIRRLLSNTERKIDSELHKAIEASGYTTDEILAMASIIEKEAYERSDVPVPQEMPMISSVLHNRLDAGMMLQCNVTATYVRGAIGPFVDNGEATYKEYYNTYYCPGLPAGAICNPGLESIKAAVYPADTNNLFFLTDDDKNFYYSETYEEHQALIEKHDVKSQ